MFTLAWLNTDRPNSFLLIINNLNSHPGHPRWRTGLPRSPDHTAVLHLSEETRSLEGAKDRRAKSVEKSLWSGKPV